MKIPLCFGEALNLPLPVLTLGVSMTIRWTAKTTQKSKMQSVDFLGLVLNRYLQFSLDLFPSFFFSSLSSRSIVLVYLMYPNQWFPRGYIILPGVTSCFYLSIFRILFIKKTHFEEHFFNDEALKMQLPAVGLWRWGTISLRAKSTHKSNLQSADFLGLVLNSFRHFSSEIFPSLSGSHFSWFVVLV